MPLAVGAVASALCSLEASNIGVNCHMPHCRRTCLCFHPRAIKAFSDCRFSSRAGSGQKHNPTEAVSSLLSQSCSRARKPAAGTTQGPRGARCSPKGPGMLSSSPAAPRPPPASPAAKRCHRPRAALGSSAQATWQLQDADKSVRQGIWNELAEHRAQHWRAKVDSGFPTLVSAALESMGEALYRAAFSGRTAKVECLLQAGAPLDWADNVSVEQVARGACGLQKQALSAPPSSRGRPNSHLSLCA